MSSDSVRLNKFTPIDWLVPHIKKSDIRLHQALQNTSDAVSNLNNYVGTLPTTGGTPGPPGPPGSAYQAGPAGNATGTYPGSYVRDSADKLKEYPDIWDFTIAGGLPPNPDGVDLPRCQIAVSGSDILLIDHDAIYNFTVDDINKSITVAGAKAPVSGVQTNWYGFIDHLHSTNPNAVFLRGSTLPVSHSFYLAQFGTDNGPAFNALFTSTANPHIPAGNWYKKTSCPWYPGQHITADGGYTRIIQGDDEWAFDFIPNETINDLVIDITGFARPMGMDSLSIMAFRAIKTGVLYKDGPNAINATGAFADNTGFQQITVSTLASGTVDSSIVGMFFASGDAFTGVPAVQGWIVSVTGSGVGAVILLNTHTQLTATTQAFEVGTAGAIWQGNPITTHIFNDVRVDGYYNYVVDPLRGNPNWFASGVFAPLRTYEELDAIGGTGVLMTQDFTCKFTKCKLFAAAVCVRVEGAIEVTFDNTWLGSGGRAIDGINPLDTYFRGTSAEMYLNFCKVTSFSEQGVIHITEYTGITITVHEWETFSHHPQIVCGDSLVIRDTSFGVNINPAISSLGYIFIDTAGNLSNPAGFLNSSVNGGVFTDGVTGYKGIFTYISATTGTVAPPPSSALTSFPWTIIKEQEQPAIQIVVGFGRCLIDNSVINTNGAEFQKVFLNTDYCNLFTDTAFLIINNSIHFECDSPFAVVKPRVAPYFVSPSNFPPRFSGIQWDNSQGIAFGQCTVVLSSDLVTINTSLSEQRPYSYGAMAPVFVGSSVVIRVGSNVLQAYIIGVTGFGVGATMQLDRPWPFSSSGIATYETLNNVAWVQEVTNDFLTIKRDFQTAQAVIGFDIVSPSHRTFNLHISGVKTSGPTQLCTLASAGVVGSHTVTLASAPSSSPDLFEYIEIGDLTDSTYDFEYGFVTAYNPSTHVITLDRGLIFSGATSVVLGPKPRIYAAVLTDSDGITFGVGGFNGTLEGMSDSSTTMETASGHRVSLEDGNLFGTGIANFGPGAFLTVTFAMQPIQLHELRLDPVTNIPEIYWDDATQSLMVQSDIAPWNNAAFATGISTGVTTYMADVTGYNGVQLKTRTQGDIVVLEAHNYPFGGPDVSISLTGIVTGDLAGGTPSLHGATMHIPSLSLTFTLDTSTGVTVAIPAPSVAISNKAWDVFPLPEVTPGIYPYGGVTGAVGWFQDFLATPRVLCSDLGATKLLIPGIPFTYSSFAPIVGSPPSPGDVLTVDVSSNLQYLPPSSDATSLVGVPIGSTMLSPGINDAPVFNGGTWEALQIPLLGAANIWTGSNTFSSSTNVVSRKVFSPTTTSPGTTGSGTYSASQITAILFAINTIITDLNTIFSSQNS